jgi:exosortase
MDLLRFSFNSNYYSYIVVIPLIVGGLLYRERRMIFAEAGFSYKSGLLLFIAGMLLFFTGSIYFNHLQENDHLSLMTFSLVITWIGGFIFFYGLKAFHKALFPLLLLVFLIPIPDMAMKKIMFMLQTGSAEATHVLFWIIGIPFEREGFIFYLPGMSIEIAEQCSGIRSSIALVITCLLVGQLFLRVWWSKTILLLCVIPITIVKNAIRIVTLSLLSVYVDESFIASSPLHRRGGIVFFLLAVTLLGIVLWFLRNREKRSIPAAE